LLTPSMAHQSNLTMLIAFRSSSLFHTKQQFFQLREACLGCCQLFDITFKVYVVEFKGLIVGTPCALPR